MSANPDVVISSVHNPALRQPHQVGGQQPSDNTQPAGKEIAPAALSTKNLGDRLSVFVRDQNSLRGIQPLARMVSNRRFGKTADYLKQLASEFSTLRAKLPQFVKLNDMPSSSPVPPRQTPAQARASLELTNWDNSREEATARGSAGLEVNQQCPDSQHVQQLHNDTSTFSRAQKTSKLEATALEGGLLQPLNVPPDVSQLLDPYLEVFNSLKAAAKSGSQVRAQLDRPMNQTAYTDEANKLLTSMSRAIPGDQETSIIDAMKARTSSRMMGREEAVSLNKGLTPTRSIAEKTPRFQNNVPHSDHLDSVLKEYVSSVRNKGEHGDFADQSARFGKDRSINVAGNSRQAITDRRHSEALDQYRLLAGGPLARTESFEPSASIEHLRQQIKTMPGRESRFEVPPLSYAKPNARSTVTESVDNERGEDPVGQIPRRLQSRSFTSEVASPMYDHEIRRILEQGTRLVEEAARPYSPPLLASPLPNPRTRM